MILKIESYLVGYSSKSDRSMSIRFTTQEVTPEQVQVLQGLLNSFGWLVFKENQITEEEIPAENAVQDKTKSRLQRTKLFIYWDLIGRPGDFESFYQGKMDRILDHLQQKIDTLQNELISKKNETNNSTNYKKNARKQEHRKPKEVFKVPSKQEAESSIVASVSV